jgi:hypothetical protein
MASLTPVLFAGEADNAAFALSASPASKNSSPNLHRRSMHEPRPPLLACAKPETLGRQPSVSKDLNAQD